MKPKSVTILFLEGCSHLRLAVERTREAIHRASDPIDLRLIKIERSDDAVRRQFLGSPTVRVEGVDVDPSALARTDFGLQCRMYSVDGRLEGAPPVAWIEAALHRNN